MTSTPANTPREETDEVTLEAIPFGPNVRAVSAHGASPGQVMRAVSSRLAQQQGLAARTAPPSPSLLHTPHNTPRDEESDTDVGDVTRLLPVAQVSPPPSLNVSPMVRNPSTPIHRHGSSTSVASEDSMIMPPPTTPELARRARESVGLPPSMALPPSPLPTVPEEDVRGLITAMLPSSSHAAYVAKRSRPVVSPQAHQPTPANTPANTPRSPPTSEPGSDSECGDEDSTAPSSPHTNPSPFPPATPTNTPRVPDSEGEEEMRLMPTPFNTPKLGRDTLSGTPANTPANTPMSTPRSSHDEVLLSPYQSPRFHRSVVTGSPCRAAPTPANTPRPRLTPTPTNTPRDSSTPREGNTPLLGPATPANTPREDVGHDGDHGTATPANTPREIGSFSIYQPAPEATTSSMLASLSQQVIPDTLPPLPSPSPALPLVMPNPTPMPTDPPAPGPSGNPQISISMPESQSASMPSLKLNMALVQRNATPPQPRRAVPPATQSQMHQGGVFTAPSSSSSESDTDSDGGQGKNGKKKLVNVLLGMPSRSDRHRHQHSAEREETPCSPAQTRWSLLGLHVLLLFMLLTHDTSIASALQEYRQGALSLRDLLTAQAALWVALVGTLIAYLSVTFSDPGYCDRDAGPESEMLTRRSSDGNPSVGDVESGVGCVGTSQKQDGDEHEAVGLLRSGGGDLATPTSDHHDWHKPHRRHCKICDIIQPYRGKHCRFCGRCVRRYDHHCAFIGTCVGQYNHGRFWWYLLFQGSLLIQSLVEMPAWFVSCDDETGCYLLNMFSGLLALILILFSLVVVGLFSVHTYLILTNQTTWEWSLGRNITYLSPYPTGAMPFYEGILRNIGVTCLWPRSVEHWALPNTIDPPNNICDNPYYSCC